MSFCFNVLSRIQGKLASARKSQDQADSREDLASSFQPGQVAECTPGCGVHGTSTLSTRLFVYTCSHSSAEERLAAAFNPQRSNKPICMVPWEGAAIS